MIIINNNCNKLITDVFLKKSNVLGSNFRKIAGFMLVNLNYSEFIEVQLLRAVTLWLLLTLCKWTLQTHHVYSTLKRCGNGNKSYVKGSSTKIVRCFGIFRPVNVVKMEWFEIVIIITCIGISRTSRMENFAWALS